MRRIIGCMKDLNNPINFRLSVLVLKRMPRHQVILRSTFLPFIDWHKHCSCDKHVCSKVFINLGRLPLRLCSLVHWFCRPCCGLLRGVSSFDCFFALFYVLRRLFSFKDGFDHAPLHFSLLSGRQSRLFLRLFASRTILKCCWLLPCRCPICRRLSWTV